MRIQKIKHWKLITQAKYEFKQDHFRPLNPYRFSEFTRDWNYNSDEFLNEHLGIVGLEIKKLNLGNLIYNFSTFNRGSIYNGYKHSFASKINSKGFKINIKGSYLITDNTEEKTSFFRPNFDISKTFQKLNKIRIGIFGEREKNTRNHALTDTLQNNSFFYDLTGAYIETTNTGKINIGVRYKRRWDYSPYLNDFSTSTIADEIHLDGKWNPSKVSRLRWNLTYRNLNIINESLTNQEKQETYLGRIEHHLNAVKGVIRSTTLYEISSGQEPELEFVYQAVNDGEGVYTWIDRNLDSIPQLDEFEIANFQDEANYVRVTTFTDRYIRSNFVQFNNSLSLNPKAIWFKEEKNMKAFLSKLALQSRLKINRKVKLGDDISQWNPFDIQIPDSSLVTLGFIYRATLFFNRSNPKYDARIGINQSNNRSILTTGFEEKSITERFFSFRWNITKRWSLSSIFTEGWRQADSEFFNQKDYKIRNYKVEPKFTYQHNKNFRIINSYKFQKGKNTINFQERISLHDINTEITFNQSSKTSIRSKFSFIAVDFIGENNTPVSFAMLEGLQNGLNYLWNISFDRKLSKNLLLSLNYEGRKTGEAKIIHVGRASIRATF